MRQTIIKCDKCGKRIEGKVFRLAFAEEYGDVVSRIDEVTDDFDLCEDCKQKLVAHIADFVLDQKPEEEPMKPKAPKAAKIDKGKVKALRNAGWKVKDIAGEMGCSNQAIYNVLKEMEDGEEGDKEPAA